MLSTGLQARSLGFALQRNHQLNAIRNKLAGPERELLYRSGCNI